MKMKNYIVVVWDNTYHWQYDERFTTEKEAIEFAQKVYRNEYIDQPTWHWHCELFYKEVIIRKSRGFIGRVA